MVEASDIIIFDRARLRHNRQRARAKLKQHQFLLDWANTQIMESLSMVNRDFPMGLQIGTKTPFAREGMIYTDITAQPLSDDITHFIQADEEFLPFADNSFDLVVSNLNLHSVNDLPGTLLQIRRILKPDGLFLASMFGGETLHELRASLTQAELLLKGGLSPRVFPFADKQQMGALLQRAGFALPVIDSDIVTVTYDSMFKMLHDLRGMGEGNIIHERSKSNPGKQMFMDAARYYQEHFAEDDGRLPASFEIVFLSGWSPDDSQQKPLRPGSAERRLSQALGADEVKTGEKATP